MTASVLIVTNSPKDWPNSLPGVAVVDARAYLTEPEFIDAKRVRVFNLCRSYRYQSIGYYVSLLAEARGHKPMPSVSTMQDLKTPAIVRIAGDEIEELVQKSLSGIKSDEFTLSIYFGRNMAKRYERLALGLFNQFQSPLLRAHFSYADDRWILRRVSPVAANDVPDSHWDFVTQSAAEYFGRRQGSSRRRRARFDLAILHKPDDREPPSNEKALKKFIRAAASLDIDAELITRDDYSRLAEFDALFIRETTSVDHHTYRFARRAAGEGLVVIDDPVSIVRCTNKVYLAELLDHHNVPSPKTLVAHQGNIDTLGGELGFPCVLKRPDSSFSLGVVKVENEEELHRRLTEFFVDSDLIVAQEFLPTTFDWRIGILDRQPLFACKYYMADGHWQIISHDKEGPGKYGKSETLPVELAPRRAVQVALKAANLIGDGLYGVDVKESNGRFYVVEVNDNPNIDAGDEDVVLKDELYLRIMSVFLRRMEQSKSRYS